jgi:hypothetical protein
MIYAVVFDHDITLLLFDDCYSLDPLSHLIRCRSGV